MRLGQKITIIIAVVLGLSILGSVQALLVARATVQSLEAMVSENVSSVRAAEELEIALLEQRGLVSSYILDRGNQRWLADMAAKKAWFTRWQARAEENARTEEERVLLRDLRLVYSEYDREREAVITLFEKGEEARATGQLLHTVSALYDRAYLLCEGLLAANERYIDARSAQARADVQRASRLVAALVSLTVVSGMGLLVLLVRGVLRPLRQMADDARAFSPGVTPHSAESPVDELHEVGMHLRALMSDVAETQTSLQRSQLRLLDSERMASLGRLAAGIGHEIRNPLTSVEMRLHSIRGSVAGMPEVEEDLRVVSEEIGHLEHTVRNFLEFARPPRPDLRSHDVTVLIEKTLELCRHWLAERGILVERRYGSGLPPVHADSEQMKQVFLNLLRNAAEAMEGGGVVEIATRQAGMHDGRRMVEVRVRDSGPGVPPEVRERILEPFFSTKPEGTGLGLCIAARILVQHDGRLELEPAGGGGASFIVRIPVCEEA